MSKEWEGGRAGRKESERTEDGGCDKNPQSSLLLPSFPRIRSPLLSLSPPILPYLCSPERVRVLDEEKGGRERKEVKEGGRYGYWYWVGIATRRLVQSNLLTHV